MSSSSSSSYMYRIEEDEHDAEDPRPPTPGPAQSAGFTFGSDGFRVAGIERESFPRIKLSKFTKPWYTAQLKLYGVSFDKNAKAKELLETLEIARKKGQTKQPTNEVVQIEKRLAAAYQQSLSDHDLVVKEWRVRKFDRLSSPDSEERFDRERFLAKYFLDAKGKPAPGKATDGIALHGPRSADFVRVVQKIPGLMAYSSYSVTVVYWKSHSERAFDKAFASLSSKVSDLTSGSHNAIATSEAEFSINRFISKYFLQDGNPSPQKWADPITLGPCFSKVPQLHTAAARVKGLNVGEAEDFHGQDFAVVGWGSKIKATLKSIAKERERLEKESAEQHRREREEEAERDRLSEEEKWAPHRRYVQTHSRSQKGALQLAELAGTYHLEVTSEKAKGYCGDDDLSLSICAPRSVHGCLAAFELRCIEGTMLLTQSEDALHALAEDMKSGSHEENDEASSVDEDESEGEKSSEEGSEGDDRYDNSRKRKAKSQGGQHAPSRRRLGIAPRAGRIYLQWAGSDPGTGEALMDVEGQSGFIDFDPSGCTANGQLKYREMFGPDLPVEFALYKTSDTPSAQPVPWSSLTEVEYW